VRKGSRHVAWRVAGFRGYADHMDTPEFQASLMDLVQWAKDDPTTIMCAEALPFRCHRQLIADALSVHGFQVLHIIGPGRAQEHRLPVFARIEGNRLIYDGGSLDLLTE
jgi:uncharacterized protein (DUF488 family)